MLYEAGLPPEMLSVITGDPREIADELITNPRVDLVTFTGGVPSASTSPSKAGYRRMVLELGGNDPIIVMDDADLDEASSLAVQGSYKNSGQRCTAVKRMLVHEKVARASPTWWWTRPAPGATATRWTRSWTDMGTVIDEAAARLFEQRVDEAVAQGARLLAGHRATARCIAPTVVDRVRPDMTLVREETFGPVSPIITFGDIDEAIAISNGTAYRPVVGGVHQPARLHHALRPSCRWARSTCARSRATGSSSRPSAASRIRAWATRKACRKRSRASPTSRPTACPGPEPIPDPGTRAPMLHLLNLLAAIALLVWGTHIVRTGMLRVFGENLRTVLGKSFANRFSALLAGLGVTSLVQSSTATASSCFVVRRPGPGGPAAALAVMLGADVGTSVMAVVYSFDLSWLSPLFIFVGVVLFISRQDTTAGRVGRVLIGLGLMLLALRLITVDHGPLTSRPPCAPCWWR
jgi:hypothetical protein